MRKTHVVIHHTGTKDGETRSWDAIRRFHIDVRGYRDIGYHIGFELVGDHYEAMLGRPFGEDGAHCPERGMNRRGLGVVLVGNFNLDPPPNELLVFAARKLRPIMTDLKIPADYDHVLRHGAVKPTDCPGKLFPFAAFIALLQSSGG